MTALSPNLGSCGTRVTFVWHVKCVTCTVVTFRLNSVELRIMTSVHLRIVIVRTLRSDSHMVDHVPRGLIYLLIQEASRVSEVLGVMTEFRRVFCTT